MVEDDVAVVRKTSPESWLLPGHLREPPDCGYYYPVIHQRVQQASPRHASGDEHIRPELTAGDFQVQIGFARTSKSNYLGKVAEKATKARLGRYQEG